MFDEYGDKLAALGCAALRINTRGHDMIAHTTGNGDYRRSGTTYEVIEECRLDLRAWVAWLRASGHESIGLWGHSLGAVKSIYYMALERDAKVRAVVATSPPRFSYRAFSAMSEGQEFVRLFTQMRRLVEEGKPQTIVDVMVPYPYVATAGQYVEKYGPEERYNFLAYLPRVRCPLLVTIGTAEAETLMTFRGLPQEVRETIGQHPNVSFASIPGADHFYSEQRAQLWEVVETWLAKL